MEDLPEEWTNTFELSLCKKCEKMTFVFMDDDGQRWCPVCREKK